MVHGTEKVRRSEAFRIRSVLAAAVGFSMVLLLFVAIATRSEGMLVLCLIACVAVVLYGAYCFGTLLESAKRMSKGDLDTKVDDKLLSGGFREFAGELNDLAGVAVVAEIRADENGADYQRFSRH